VVVIQACLNGGRGRDDHPGVPVLLDELVRSASACAEAGASSLHVHPRDATGRETLDPALVDTAAGALRAASGLPVGVTTGAWIEPDPERRRTLVAGWSVPDFASVNLYEPGFAGVMWALLDDDIGIEAGIETEADVERLAGSGLAGRVMRVLVEVVDSEPEEAARHALAIDRALDDMGVGAPRLHHGVGRATWAVVAQGARLGREVRVGFEDVRTLPGGQPAPDNAALVRAAKGLREAA
jgi:uncharacterized protein (DUF849 family)